MRNMPGFFAAAPAPHRQHQPLSYGAAAALHVNASCQHQHAGGDTPLLTSPWVAVTVAFIFAALCQAVAGELAGDGILPGHS